MIDALTRSTTVLVGEFGAGKTEISIALALRLAQSGERVALVDLDIVTPYFRPRDIAAELAVDGVDVLALSHAAGSIDIPAVPGATGSVLAEGCRGRRTVVVDPGGGAPGVRVFGSVRDRLRGDRLRVLLVLNRRRGDPSPRGVRELAASVTNGTGLRLTHLVSNSHLREETDLDLVADGVGWAREMAEALNLPLLFAAVPLEIAVTLPHGIEGLPVLALERRMKLPWENA